MAMSPHDPEVLYYGSQYVHRTRDKGVTWEKISPDLTANPECCQGVERRADHARRHGRGVLQHALRDHRVAAREGRDLDRRERRPVLTSRATTARRGRTSRRRICRPGGRVQCIEASPHRRGSAYFAVYRYLLGDYAPYIYRTDDYGKTWTQLTDGKNGIPADWPTRVVREDPDREGLLYAGTEFGMFISFDNGAHWQPFQLNLPNVPITDIKVHQQGSGRRDAGPRVLDSRQHQFAASAYATSCVNGRVTCSSRATAIALALSPANLGPAIEYYLPANTPGSGHNRVRGCERRT